jgi:hypothetical protein
MYMKKNFAGSERNAAPDLNTQRELSRRRFLEVAAVTGISSMVPTAGVALEAPAAPMQEIHPKASVPARALPNPIIPNFQGEYGSSSTPSFQIPKRPMGSTGLQVSILGMGGYHLGAAISQDIVNNMVAKALDHGINFFDNAWEYQGGAGEERLGIALKGKRDQAILVTGVCTYGRKKISPCACLKIRLPGCRPIISTSGRCTMSSTTTIPNLLTRWTESSKP